jgi:hypothetical protein
MSFRWQALARASSREGAASPSSRPHSAPKYQLFAPKPDTDGLDVAGIRPMEVAAPVATLTGWALRGAGRLISSGHALKLQTRRPRFAPSPARKGLRRCLDAGERWGKAAAFSRERSAEVKGTRQA